MVDEPSISPIPLPSIEERRFEEELLRQQRADALAERQFAADQEYKRQEHAVENRKLGFWRTLLATPLLAPAIAAYLAYVTTQHSDLTARVTAESSARAALGVEAKRDEAQLIVQALSGRDQSQAIVALQFLAKAGMIPDYHDAVMKLTMEKGGVAIPSSPPPQPQSTFSKDYSVDYVVTLPSNIEMKLPPDLRCSQIRPLSFIFQPKRGMPIYCKPVDRDRDTALPFDRERFERELSGSVVK